MDMGSQPQSPCFPHAQRACFPSPSLQPFRHAFRDLDRMLAHPVLFFPLKDNLSLRMASFLQPHHSTTIMFAVETQVSACFTPCPLALKQAYSLLTRGAQGTDSNSRDLAKPEQHLLRCDWRPLAHPRAFGK